jgi:hypothetical protein
MEADDARFLGILEVAGDGVADHRFQFVESIGFSENGKTECPRPPSGDSCTEKMISLWGMSIILL